MRFEVFRSSQSIYCSYNRNAFTALPPGNAEHFRQRVYFQKSGEAAFLTVRKHRNKGRFRPLSPCCAVTKKLPLALSVASAKALVSGCARVAARHGLYLNAFKRTNVTIAVIFATGDAAPNRLATHIGFRHRLLPPVRLVSLVCACVRYAMPQTKRWNLESMGFFFKKCRRISILKTLFQKPRGNILRLGSFKRFYRVRHGAAFKRAAREYLGQA